MPNVVLMLCTLSKGEYMFFKRLFPVVMSCLALSPCIGHAQATEEGAKDVGCCPSYAFQPVDYGATGPELLDPATQTKFVNDLPNPLSPDFIWKPDGKTEDDHDFYKIQRKCFMADLGIVDPQGTPLLTPMFGFASKHQGPTFPGRTFVVNKSQKIKVFWENKLLNEETGMPLALPRYVPFDNTIHSADMMMNPHYPTGGVPTITHLHGGFTKDIFDGHPDAWATPNFVQTGDFFTKKPFAYDNDQPGAMLWYHDHALGFTRLNNYSGLVGAYIIQSKTEKKLRKEHLLPAKQYEMPLVIVDKMFTAQGELFFPYINTDVPTAPVPSVLPEFFGNFMLVNGKAWPKLSVEPRQYRFRLLNGCDSRFLQLQLVPDGITSGIRFYQIGTDQSLLNAPVEITELMLAPAQRADIIVDFSNYQNEYLTMTNSANAPFPGGDPVTDSTAQIMRFVVDKPLNTDIPVSQLPTTLLEHPIQRLAETAPTRQVLLFETTDEFARIEPMLGTPLLGKLHWTAPTTEVPFVDSTEIWEIYNTTADAHPIHLHAGNFQVLDRQYFTAIQDPITGALTNIQMLGSPVPVTGAELGLFDTTIVPPLGDDAPPTAIGQRTRIIMHFTIPGSFVWHCHILSHEDHDMMRPMYIQHG